LSEEVAGPIVEYGSGYAYRHGLLLSGLATMEAFQKQQTASHWDLADPPSEDERVPLQTAQEAAESRKYRANPVL